METKQVRGNEILDKIMAEHGTLPLPIRMMSKRPGTVEKFMAYSKHILEVGSLDKREKALIAIAAAVALRADHCIQVKVEEAKKAGISEDEIIQAVLIVGLLVGNTAIHTAQEAFGGPSDGE